MPRNPIRIRSLLASTAVMVSALASLTSGCGSPAAPNGTTSYTKSLGWTCASGVDCQDVFDFQMTAGTTVTFKVTNVSSGSVAELALYGPGSALSGTNLFTGNATAVLCNVGASCDNNTAGQAIENFAITHTGTYRLTVTRNWGFSCGGSGTYDLSVTSASTFQPLGQTSDDTATLSVGQSCPVK